jgi:hypothetical protein
MLRLLFKEMICVTRAKSENHSFLPVSWSFVPCFTF